MDPKDPQFEYGKPRNSFEEVWAVLYGNSGSDRSLSAMQKKQDEQKAAEQKETDDKFNEIIKNNETDKDK
jgi:hypothetical protein